MNRYEFALFVQHENLTVPFQGEGRKAEVRGEPRKLTCSGRLLSQPTFEGLSRSPVDTRAHYTIPTQKATQFSFSLCVCGLGWKGGGEDPKEPSAQG